MDLEAKLSQFLLDPRIPDDILFAKVWGSWSHNTNLPSSDVDFCAVWAAETKDILSLNPPKETVDGKDPDFQSHEVAKFCRLLLKGNPAILEMLFTDRFCYSTRPWLELKAERRRFLSRRAVSQYLGYANGQLHRLTMGSYLHTTGGRYNEKWAYHLIRVLYDGGRVAAGGDPVVWKEGAERKELMEIRTGLWSQGAVEMRANELFAEANKALESSQLPDEGDRAFLNDWLLSVRRV